MQYLIRVKTKECRHFTSQKFGTYIKCSLLTIKPHVQRRQNVHVGYVIGYVNWKKNIGWWPVSVSHTQNGLIFKGYVKYIIIDKSCNRSNWIKIVCLRLREKEHVYPASKQLALMCYICCIWYIYFGSLYWRQ